MITYPKVFTDAEWKKAEKAIKVSATGVGKSLRDLQKMAGELERGIVAVTGGKAQPAQLKQVVVAIQKNAKVAADLVAKVMAEERKKKNAPAEKFLIDLNWKLNDYASELGGFDPADHRGLAFSASKVDSRITSRIGKA